MQQEIAETTFEGQLADHYRQTRRGIIERLADPYLTDHDRWVLGQFERFLSGHVPEPDPRVSLSPIQRPLHVRVTRSTL